MPYPHPDPNHEWEATPELRYQARHVPHYTGASTGTVVRVLQQQVVEVRLINLTHGHDVVPHRHRTGRREWRDVPEVEE